MKNRTMKKNQKKKTKYRFRLCKPNTKNKIKQ